MPENSPSPLLLIVTGAHLRAEVADRPLAYHLRAKALKRLAEGGDEAGAGDLDGRIVVCSDIWYLNQDHLRGLPTIAIGHPDVNALTAHLVPRLPTAFVIDGRCSVQLDPELTDAVAACWGVDDAATARAVEAFIERYLEAFVERIVE